MSLYDDPIAVLNKITELADAHKLDVAKFQANGHGANAARSRLRRYTHGLTILGRHFRDLTGKVGEDRTKRVQAFIVKWEKRTKKD